MRRPAHDSLTIDTPHTLSTMLLRVAIKQLKTACHNEAAARWQKAFEAFLPPLGRHS